MGKCLPVVAVVATHGEDRVGLLTVRALPSIAKQTTRPDLVVVVSDNGPTVPWNEPLIKENDVTDCFEADYRENVRLIPNNRTHGNSGTGAWNTGIFAALDAFGQDCFVAILDDDDEWEKNHIEACLEAAGGSQCQWVVSGIIRCSQSGRKQEPLLASQPKASQFFSTNPGVQGSNLFVKTLFTFEYTQRHLLTNYLLVSRSRPIRVSSIHVSIPIHSKATTDSWLSIFLFHHSECLPATTDRDLCIRLCDLLSGSEDWFASTGQYTVIHHADANRLRVSSKGSPAKVVGLQRFFVKHGPAMSESERVLFKERAASLFGCGEEKFCVRFDPDETVQKFKAWSGDELPLNMGTVKKLPKLQVDSACTQKRDALFGIITGNIKRIVALLDDLRAASESEECDFDPFVVVFVNSANLSRAVDAEIKKRQLRGHIQSRESPAVQWILQHCNIIDPPTSDKKLPIAMARTVLQVFIYNMPIIERADAVIIIDDDKRLPKGWSPFVDPYGADILIGRDLRTPPNPSLFSLRTNLIDLLYNLDLLHMKGSDKDSVKSYCLTQSHLVAQSHLKDNNKPFDWYYDLSSSFSTHLEMPVYSDAPTDIKGPPQRLLRNFLVGTPLVRDVCPLECGETTQRGGCMVILKKCSKSFEPLAVQQHAPSIRFSDDTTSLTRRSDSFWCKEMKDRGFSIAVQKDLFVYHDNRFDEPASAEAVRKSIVQEVIGGILCRKVKFRKKYRDARLLELRSWFERVKGIITSLRNRPYCTDQLALNFIAPLEEIFHREKWEEEVFAVIERSFGASLERYKPNPIDFARLNNCEKGDSIMKCTNNFDDPKLLSFAFPILSSGVSESRIEHLNQEGNPFRFEVRISFVHLGRLVSLLPLQIPEHECNTKNQLKGPCIKRGWWHTLDDNIANRNLKSSRGSVGDRKSLFFIHPPNKFKDAGAITNLGLVSDIIAGNHFTASDLEKKTPWRKQLGQVNLQSTGRGWFTDRLESVVVAIDISGASYGSAVQSFEYLRRLQEARMFRGCGVIVFDNGSANREDISSALFRRAKDDLGCKRVTAISWRKRVENPDLQRFVRSMCSNSHALVFIMRGGYLDLKEALCLLPDRPLEFCPECSSYYEVACECYEDRSVSGVVEHRSPCEFDATPCTHLPTYVPSIQGRKATHLRNTKFFATHAIEEGKLRIEVTALVNGLNAVEGAKGVYVRIHSECLTGDNFYSMKCDCGTEKLQFLHIMAEEEKRSRPSILVYIKGHEGRGAGLSKKIKAYAHLERNPDNTHVDALHAVGCESDIRKYDAAARFVKHKLKIKSLVLFTNNPHKIEAAKRCFGHESVSSRAMPAAPTAYNGKYLKEKVDLLGHEGLVGGLSAANSSQLWSASM
ncbi:hypothetical protein ACHAWF_017646 [Thalassiosira exigua]